MFIQTVTTDGVPILVNSDKVEAIFEAKDPLVSRILFDSLREIQVQEELSSLQAKLEVSGVG